MSNNKELIQAVSLLNQALIMLVNESYSKEKYIESLQKPRSDLSKDFQDFLLHKNQKELQKIMEFVCACEKFIDAPTCSEEEVKQEMTETQKKALTLILENDKVAAKVAKLQEEVELKKIKEHKDEV